MNAAPRLAGPIPQPVAIPDAQVRAVLAAQGFRSAPRSFLPVVIIALACVAILYAVAVLS